LKAHDKVLDVGSGIGQKARVLASYLNNDGSYDGFDVLKSAIEWCQEHYEQYPNFKFQHTDIINSHYNQEGKIKSSEFIFPYPDHYFDLVFLSSIFTHMLPKDMEHYISEIHRVLKTGGKCLVTFFLLNEESRSNMDKETCKIKIPHIYETDKCRVADLENPEMIVAHDEDRVRHLFLSNNLGICEIAYGDWCGRKELLGCLQDYMIAVS
jgi:SAM-dependent methyltransferase